MTYGIDNHRPLTTTQKGVIIAGTTVLAPLLGPVFGVGAAGGRTFHALWRLRPFTVPLTFGMTPRLPGGGGPGSGTSASTDQARAEHYRFIYGGY